MVPQRHNEENERCIATAKRKILAGIRSHKAFLEEWDQEIDYPSRMHAEDSKNSHKLDTFWRHTCWWTTGQYNAAAGANHNEDHDATGVTMVPH